LDRLADLLPRKDIMRLPGPAEIFSFFSNLAPLTPSHILCMARGAVPAMTNAISSLTRHNSPLSGASTPNPRSLSRAISPRSPPKSPVPFFPGLNDSMSSVTSGIVTSYTTAAARIHAADHDEQSLAPSWTTAVSTNGQPSRSISAGDPLATQSTQATNTPLRSLASAKPAGDIEPAVGTQATGTPFQSFTSADTAAAASSQTAACAPVSSLTSANEDGPASNVFVQSCPNEFDNEEAPGDPIVDPLMGLVPLSTTNTNASDASAPQCSAGDV
jgi:hypothetical protein